ncbi:MAG: hypothetical protein JRJ03_02595 [Deltaproteobacteria bacterium]|nr:hypothetical protein [Deltaproteobacteria bacterium]MBW2063802.1 hypothetical protein [Deltaproteobacteria bacterium]
MTEDIPFRCEFCERSINHEPVRKKIRGKDHRFCSQSCFVLWRYDMPRNDREVFYSKYVVPVPVSNIDD